LTSIVANRIARYLVPTVAFYSPLFRVVGAQGLFRASFLGGFRAGPVGSEIELGDGKFVTRVHLSAREGATDLKVTDAMNVARTEVGSRDQSTEYVAPASYVVLRDTKGRERVVIGVNEVRGAQIALFDDKGQTVWSAP
jgi:hypothetical protein